jgi:hypothetical protein
MVARHVACGRNPTAHLVAVAQPVRDARVGPAAQLGPPMHADVGRLTAGAELEETSRRE